MLSTGSYVGTLSIRLRYLARHLAGEWEVTVVAPPADKYNGFRADYALKPALVRLVQPWAPATRWAVLNLVLYLCTSLVSVLRARAEVVVISKPTPVTVVGLVPKLLYGARVVTDLDDLGAEVMRGEGRSRLACGLVGWSERLCVRYADAVVVASAELREHVQRVHPAKPVLLLPNGVEPGEYQVAAELPPRRAVYYFGALNRLGLIEELLQAMPAVLRQVPDARLTIVGGGSALDDAKGLSRELGIEAAVAFPGWQTDMLAVQDYARFADVGVCYLPDLRTVRAASSMKVFQYMAMGTVPLVSDVGDLPSYLNDGQAGVVVEPGSVPALERALTGLLQDEQRRVRLAREAWRLAGDAHSWQARAEALSAFLSKANAVT